LKILHKIFIGSTVLFLIGCSAVDTTANEFQLSAFSIKQTTAKHGLQTLLVTAPEAVSGYQTAAMLYIRKPYKLETFAKNAWADPPGDMLYPLITESLQRSGYFFAVASSTNGEVVDYRLDTQLLRLQQNFLKKPSEIDLAVKVVLNNVKQNRVIASKVISLQIPCLADTPYAGVVAANKGTMQLTEQITQFVLDQVKNS